MDDMDQGSDQPAGGEPGGQGTAANGRIEALVGPDGRLATLRLDAGLRKLGPDGPVMSSEQLAAEIVTAVNTALDDWDERLKSAAGGDLAARLDAMADDFERSLDQLSDDIFRAERRLDT